MKNEKKVVQEIQGFMNWQKQKAPYFPVEYEPLTVIDDAGNIRQDGCRPNEKAFLDNKPMGNPFGVSIGYTLWDGGFERNEMLDEKDFEVRGKEIIFKTTINKPLFANYVCNPLKTESRKISRSAI